LNTSVSPFSLAALQARHGSRYRWLLLVAVMVGTMASIMSSTIVNVAIPDMSQHFSLGQGRAQWVSSGFMVAMTVSMLTTPWLLARYGYRGTYAACMLLLMAGGLLGGLAGSFGVVMLARVAEGLAAGVVQPIPAIIIMRAFGPHEQGRASGLFGMGVVLAPALGPSIGGVLVDLFGWRSIFFMVVPLCLLSLWMAWRYVPDTSPGGMAANRRGAMIDWRGLLLAAVGTLCLLNGMVALHGNNTLQAAMLLGAFVLTLGAFLGWQRRLTATDRVPLMSAPYFCPPAWCWPRQLPAWAGWPTGNRPGCWSASGWACWPLRLR
jgi:MFS family permease